MFLVHLNVERMKH